jgi:type II secretory pathway pseudopilin PulG
MLNNKPIRNHRTGFSIIEVLTSIVVAMIGVFGVMVLIPFAVKQAQTGLDSDAATVVARNAFDQFEISGYRNTSAWTTNSPAIGTAPMLANPANPEAFSIDPLGITENVGNVNHAKAVFPFHQTDVNGLAINAYPTSQPYQIRAVNLRTPTGQQMSVADARRMFRSADKLVFGNAIDSAVGGDADFNGPQQIFDVGTSGGPLRRQTEGNISWSAIVVPVKDITSSASASSSAWKYRMYILVYKDRITDVTDDKSMMVTAKVDGSKTPGFASPLSTVFLSDDTVDVESGSFRKGDWVMLVNENASAPTGYKTQLAFCRVVNFANGTPPTITLDGPDFEFGPGGSRDTHIVHLKDVVGVYERTFTPEGSSNWNISF